VESDWRWNVFEIGATGDVFELCARITSFTQPTYVCKRIYNDGFYSVAALSGFPGGSPYSSTTFPIPAEFPHFPYGFEVLPDHP